MANSIYISPSGGLTDLPEVIVVDSTNVDPVDGSLVENEEKSSDESTGKVDSVTAVSTVVNKSQPTTLSNHKVAYATTLARRTGVWLKKDRQYQKEAIADKNKIAKLKSNLRGQKEEY